MFLGISIKGCIESTAIRAGLIVLVAITAVIFIPYCLGLLVIACGLPGPTWPAGAGFIIIGTLIITTLVKIYKAVYDYLIYKQKRGVQGGKIP